MHIVFLQQLWYEWQAPMLLSAIAKQKGHSVRLFIEPDPERAARRIAGSHADLAVFSSIVTGNMDYVYACAEQIKARTKAFIVAGGPHISLFYKEISLEHIDYLGVGEGELFFAGLLDAIEHGTALRNVPGLYYKRMGEYVLNAPETVADLDKLPVPDRELYYSYAVFRREKVRLFYSGRGCKYACRHCCVPLLTELGGEARVRRRSPRSLVEEIVQVKDRYGLKAAFFQDDAFTQDADWLEAFLTLYKKKVGRPLMCMSRAGDITPEVANLLKSAGCVSVGIGVETANEKTRASVLGRYESNPCISNAISLLKDRHIKVTTFNMIGIPTEDMADVKETMQFNHNSRVDAPWGILYQPYVNGKRDAACGPNGFSGNFYSKLGYDHPQARQLEKTQKLFPLLVKHPFCMRILSKTITRPAAYLLFAAYSFWREVRIWRRSFLLTFIVGVKNQLLYRKIND